EWRRGGVVALVLTYRAAPDAALQRIVGHPAKESMAAKVRCRSDLAFWRQLVCPAWSIGQPQTSQWLKQVGQIIGLVKGLGESNVLRGEVRLNLKDFLKCAMSARPG